MDALNSLLAVTALTVRARTRRTRLLVALLAVAAPLTSSAKPGASQIFCDVYPHSASCEGRGITCLECHTSTSPETVSWNAFGEEVRLALTGPLGPTTLPDALQRVEAVDSDGDSVGNGEEILAGTLPGDVHSFLMDPVAGSGDANPGYNVGAYDVRFAYRRMAQVFCGTAPSFAQMQALDASPDPTALLHQQLDACLDSAYWTQEALPRLADERIRPIDLGAAYNWDYRLWRYVFTGNRDLRDLLLAQYHVREPHPGELLRVEETLQFFGTCESDTQCGQDAFCTCTSDQGGVPPHCMATGQGGGVVEVGEGQCQLMEELQALDREHRAGMLGTNWFHFINTMFSAMPRTTAAQAMRSYLGMDIARQEGIRPVVDEPKDVDHKNVKQAECAQCHSTLDPATYVFAYHHGIPGGPSTYDVDRPASLGLWGGDAGPRPQGYLLGQPVSSLREWALVAASSDAFKRTMTLTLFAHVVGRPPQPADQQEFEALWKGLETQDSYSANRLLHRMVKTRAFGAP